MSATNTSIIAFNAGEISPVLQGRWDLDKYPMSCRTLENWRPTKFGAATKRAGTQFIAETKFNDQQSRLLRFQFSTSTTYAIEAGDEYMRFYDDGSIVTVPTGSAWLTSTAYVVGDLATDSGNTYYCLVAHTSGTLATDVAAGKWVLLGVTGNSYEITSPYTDLQIFDVHYAQINDVIYFCHPDVAVYKLSRVEDYYWTLEEVVWTWPALREENIDDTITITPSAKTGSSITLTASSDLFYSGHIGSYWYIEHRTEGTSVQCDLSGSAGSTNSSAIRIKGEWQLTTSERWYGTLQLQRSETGAWAGEEEVIREFKSESDRNVSVAGEESEKVYLRLYYTAAGDPYGDPPFSVGSTGTASDVTYTYFEAKATLEAAEQFLGGIVKITAVGGPTSATATSIVDLEGTTATEYWAEGSWSDYRGHPRTVSHFEQRLVFASNDAQKQTLWFSQSGDFENFEYGSGDSDAMTYTLGGREFNEILWLVPHTRMIVGTTGGEYAIGSSDQQTPLTATNVVVRQQSNFGSKSLQAVQVNDVVLFIQRQGRKIRELTYSFEKDSYVAPDMTILSEHITKGGVTQVAYQQQPDAVLWLTRSDGQLIGMTYERDENVVGWFRYVTDGEIESVATLYGEDQDQLWIIVKRTINGSTKRYVERFAVQDDTTAKEDLIFLDSALTFDGGAALSISGMTNARPPVVTIATHGIADDSNVRVTGTGIEELDGQVFTVKNGTASTFELYLTDGTTPADTRVPTEYTITGAAGATLTIGAHHFVVGDNVSIYTPTTPPVSAPPATVIAVGGTTIDINYDGSSLTAYVVRLVAGADAYVSGGTVEVVENTFTNLSHLEGKTVRALVDGATVPDEVVSSGTVTLDEYGNTVQVGLPFTATLQPQKLAIQTQQGTSVGRNLRISEATLRLYRTMGIRFGENSTVAADVIFRDTDDNMDDSPDLFTGDKMVEFAGNSNRSGDMVILSEDPLPATILAIVPKVGVGQ